MAQNPLHSTRDTYIVTLFSVILLLSICIPWKEHCDRRPGQPDRQNKQYRRIPRQVARVENIARKQPVQKDIAYYESFYLSK